MNNCAVGVLETITLTPLVHGKDVLDGRQLYVGAVL